MPFHVRLSTTLRDRVPGYSPADGINTDIPLPATVRDLAESLGLPLGEIAIIMVNGMHADLDTALADGDRVALFPAVGGG